MGKFIIRTGKAGVRFRLLAGNGQTIGSSEVYRTYANCLGGISSVRTCSQAQVLDLTAAGSSGIKHPRYEVFQDKAGEYRFRLKARNGEIILASEGYREKASCLNGLDSVRRNAPSAELVNEGDGASCR